MNVSAKRHHWWPVCHSKLWVDEDNCIIKTDASGKTLRTTPANTAVIKNFNTISGPNGEIDSSLETFFADQIESPAAPVLARLSSEKSRDFALEARFDMRDLHANRRDIKNDGFMPDQKAFSAALSQQERRALERYIASLMVRIPSYKKRLNGNSVVENLARTLEIPIEEARLEADIMHIDFVRTHLEEYAARFRSCMFLLCDSANLNQSSPLEFLIGDTPVVPSSLGLGDAEAMCPLSPDRALVIIRGYSAPLPDRIPIFRCLEKTTKWYNRVMVQNAEREIFSRKPIPPGYVQKHLGSRTVRILPKVTQSAAPTQTAAHLLKRIDRT